MESIAESIGIKNKQYELFLIANNFDEFEKRVINRSNEKYLSSEYNAKYFEISCMKKINIYELLIWPMKNAKDLMYHIKIFHWKIKIKISILYINILNF